MGSGSRRTIGRGGGGRGGGAMEENSLFYGRSLPSTFISRVQERRKKIQDEKRNLFAANAISCYCVCI